MRYDISKDNVFIQAKNIANYEKLKNLRDFVCNQIENFNENVNFKLISKNPREHIQRQLNKNNLRVLIIQKDRLNDKIEKLEEIIKIGMKEI